MKKKEKEFEITFTMTYTIYGDEAKGFEGRDLKDKAMRCAWGYFSDDLKAEDFDSKIREIK